MEFEVYKLYITALFLIIVITIPVLSYAQYSSSSPLSPSLEEQLKLAKEKISNAKQNGAYGSGTSMFGYNLDNTMLMIIAIGIIMSVASAIFFLASINKGKKKHKTSSFNYDNRTPTSNYGNGYGTDTNEAMDNNTQYLQNQIYDLTKKIEELQRKVINK